MSTMCDDEPWLCIMCDEICECELCDEIILWFDYVIVL
jgi:hypothetical protein